jgi:hypothetical protein
MTVLRAKKKIKKTSTNIQQVKARASVPSVKSQGKSTARSRPWKNSGFLMQTTEPHAATIHMSIARIMVRAVEEKNSQIRFMETFLNFRRILRGLYPTCAPF